MTRREIREAPTALFHLVRVLFPPNECRRAKKQSGALRIPLFKKGETDHLQTDSLQIL
jgi:hypothetical protein